MGNFSTRSRQGYEQNDSTAEETSRAAPSTATGETITTATATTKSTTSSTIKRSLDSMSKFSVKTSTSLVKVSKKEIMDANMFPVLATMVYIAVLIVLLVSLSMETWTEREVQRGQTFLEYTQGPLRRCINDHTEFRCAYIHEINCSLELDPLVGTITELTLATDNSNTCVEMKTQLSVTITFVFLGLIFMLVASLFICPCFTSKLLYLLSAIAALFGTIFLIISLLVYGLIENTFSGFFSINGEPVDGCLAHGYGLVVAAAALGVCGTITSIAATVKQLAKEKKSETSEDADLDD